MANTDILEPVTLTGSEKEQYLNNLEKALITLSCSLEKSDIVHTLQADFAGRISNTVSLLKYNSGQANPAENTGIHTRLNIDPRYGLPSLEEVILFSSEAESAEKKRLGLPSTGQSAEQAADVLFNHEPVESSWNEILVAEQRIREKLYYQSLGSRNFAHLPEGLSSRVVSIELAGEDRQVEHFDMFYAGWEMAKGFFSSYYIQMDDDKDKYLKLGPEKPGHIFKGEHSGRWEYSDNIRRILSSSFGLHPQQYFGSLNELEGIHPKTICYLGFERFESIHASAAFTEIINRHPASAILTATAIKLEGRQETGSGKTRQTVIDFEKDSTAALFVVCSEETKSEIIEYYKHNKYVDFEIISY